MLGAAAMWQWIERNVATFVSKPQHPRPEFHPFRSWEEVEGVAAELGSVFGPLVVFSVGAGWRARLS